MDMSLNQSRCPECDTRVTLDECRGETVCSECGIIVSETVIDRGPEWTGYDSQEREEQSRVGRPVTNSLHDKGLSTVIGQDRDAAGNTLSASKRQQMQRLRRWDERYRARNSKESNLRQALGEINRIACTLGLPKSSRETASVIYRRALKMDLVMGHSIEGMATAAVYAAARQAGIPRTLDEVARVSRVDQQRIARDYRHISRELGLEIEPTDPSSYLPKFASELECSEELRRQAHELLRAVADTNFVIGKNPVGLAAAALYAASLLVGENLKQSKISSVTDITSMTIRNHYRDLIVEAGADDGQ